MQCGTSVGYLGGFGINRRKFFKFYSVGEIYGLERAAGVAGLSELDS